MRTLVALFTDADAASVGARRREIATHLARLDRITRYIERQRGPDEPPWLSTELAQTQRLRRDLEVELAQLPQRVAIYARTWDDDWHVVARSLSAQVERGQRFVHTSGHLTMAQLVFVGHEDGRCPPPEGFEAAGDAESLAQVLATATHRPVLQQLLSAARDGACDAVWVAALDRLATTTREMMYACAALRAAGVALHLPDLIVTHATPGDTFQLHTRMVMAEYCYATRGGYDHHGNIAKGTPFESGVPDCPSTSIIWRARRGSGSMMSPSSAISGQRSATSFLLTADR
jgi:hypothetical protein